MKTVFMKFILGIALMTYSINAVDITTWKASYPSGDNNVWMQLHDKPNNNQDWIGIYPANSDNSWANVVQWKWARNTSPTEVDQGDWYKFENLADGEYEARFFLNNSFVVTDKVSFTVGNNVNAVTTSKNTYNTTENISVNVQTNHHGDEDWVGIFKKGDNNSWGNVVKWDWVHNQNTVALQKLPAGEYEVRLFFDNEYGVDAVARATYGFSVNDGGNNYVYGSEGPYLDKVIVKDDISDKYIVYYPEGHVQDAPLVLVVGYMDTTIFDDDKGHRLEGIMRHLASLGCYVIGHKHIAGGNAWANTTNTVKRREYFIDAVNKASEAGVDTSKLAIVGKSLGGMHSYALMKYFKDEGYGGEKSFILDLMGWYALDMNKEDLEALDVDALILHYGGKTGVQTEYSQDPRTLITISKLLKQNNNNVGFITLDTTNHSYEGGLYNDLKAKPTLLKPIDAMFRYEFFNNDGKYNNARAILFDNYDTTVQQSYEATINYIGQDTSHDKYGDLECSLRNGIDYCKDHGLQ